jgi:hypothetical protein
LRTKKPKTHKKPVKKGVNPLFFRGDVKSVGMEREKVLEDLVS